jgi:hypothetical protein
MDAKRCAIHVCGWLALIGGYGFALLLIRGVFIGSTRGFGAARSQAVWIVVAYLLYLAVVVYFYTLGGAHCRLRKVPMVSTESMVNR